VKVISFEGMEDLYGILVNIQVGHQGYIFPLSDVKATNKRSSNYGLTDD
jgi:hypothetical protein